MSDLSDEELEKGLTGVVKLGIVEKVVVNNEVKYKLTEMGNKMRNRFLSEDAVN